MVFQAKRGGKKGNDGGRTKGEAQEYLEDPKEYNRKSVAKNRGQDIPEPTRKSPAVTEDGEVRKKRGRPSNSPSGPQSSETRNENAKKYVKKKRLSEKRRKAVGQRKDKKKGEGEEGEEEEDRDENENIKKGVLFKRNKNISLILKIGDHFGPPGGLV